MIFHAYLMNGSIVVTRLKSIAVNSDTVEEIVGSLERVNCTIYASLTCCSLSHNLHQTDRISFRAYACKHLVRFLILPDFAAVRRLKFNYRDEECCTMIVVIELPHPNPYRGTTMVLISEHPPPIQYLIFRVNNIEVMNK